MIRDPLALLYGCNPFLGAVVGVAFFVNTIIAVLIGGTVPIVLKRFGFDNTRSARALTMQLEPRTGVL